MSVTLLTILFSVAGIDHPGWAKIKGESPGSHGVLRSRKLNPRVAHSIIAIGTLMSRSITVNENEELIGHDYFQHERINLCATQVPKNSTFEQSHTKVPSNECKHYVQEGYLATNNVIRQHTVTSRKKLGKRGSSIPHRK